MRRHRVFVFGSKKCIIYNMDRGGNGRKNGGKTEGKKRRKRMEKNQYLINESPPKNAQNLRKKNNNKILLICIFLTIYYYTIACNIRRDSHFSRLQLITRSHTTTKNKHTPPISLYLE